MKNIFTYLTIALATIASAKGQQSNTNSPEDREIEAVGDALPQKTSQAYEAVALQLMMKEANYFVKQLKLPTPYPIQISDLQVKSVDFLCPIPDTNSAPERLFDASIPREQRIKALQWGVSGFFETTNFSFEFMTGRLWSVCRDCKRLVIEGKHPLLGKPSLINDAQAHQLATQWLAAIDIDVVSLDKKYKYGISRQYAGDVELPVYYVNWGSMREDAGRDFPQIRVEVLGTTKELREITIQDSSFSRRPPIIITNAIELNNIPDPPATNNIPNPPSLQKTNAPPSKDQQSDIESPVAREMMAMIKGYRLALFKPSVAYQKEVFSRMKSEVDYVVKQLHLPTAYPINEEVAKAQIAQPWYSVIKDTNPPFLPATVFSNRIFDASIPREQRVKSLQIGIGGNLQTTNFFFGFDQGKLLVVSRKEYRSVEFLGPIKNKPSQIDDAQAHQLATQWLAAIDVDVAALEKKYTPEISQDEYLNVKMPIHYVRWGKWRNRDRDGKPVGDSSSPCVEVQILGTTKELMGIRLMDNSFSRRPPVIVTHAIELNLQPDPQPATLQKLPPPQTNSPSP